MLVVREVMERVTAATVRNFFPVLGTEGSQEACDNPVGNSLTAAVSPRPCSLPRVSLVLARADEGGWKKKSHCNMKSEIPSVLYKMEMNSQAQ